MVLKIIANLNGGDLVTPDNELTYKIYGSADNYASPIATLGSAINDAKVSVTSGVVTIDNVDVGTEDEFKISSVDEAGNEAELSNSSLNKLYVRPAGTTYGDSSGDSYANAWSGFNNVDNAKCEGNTLVVSGTHTENFNVGFNGTISFNDEAGSGEIDATGIATGMNINGFDCILNNPIINNATVQNIYFEDSISTVNSATLNNSSNQGVQHWSGSNVTYNGVIVSNDNEDEGMSGHLDALVTINGTFESKRNGQAAINHIEDSKFTINGLVDFSDNVTADVFSTNATTARSCKCTINSNNTGLVLLASGGSEIEMNAGIYQDVKITTEGFIKADNVIIQDLSEFDGSLDVSNSYIVISDYQVRSSSPLKVRNCNIDLRTVSGNITIIDGDIVDIQRSRINCANAFADQIITNASGNLILNHNEFINIPDSKFAIVVEDTSLSNIIDNNVIDGNVNGRGILTQQNVTINNNVFIDTAIRVFLQQSATLTMNNCLSFNADTDRTSEGTLIENNELTTDPLFTDSANNDYSLQALSPCIGAGIAVFETLGIDTANFGSITVVPIIVTKEQTNPPNIGVFA